MENKDFYSKKNMRLLTEYLLELKETLALCKVEVLNMYDEFRYSVGVLRFSFFGRSISVQKFIGLLGYFFVNPPEFLRYDISKIKNKKNFLQEAEMIKSGTKKMEKFIKKQLWQKLPEKDELIQDWLNSVEYGFSMAGKRRKCHGNY